MCQLYIFIWLFQLFSHSKYLKLTSHLIPTGLCTLPLIFFLSSGSNQIFLVNSINVTHCQNSKGMKPPWDKGLTLSCPYIYVTKCYLMTLLEVGWGDMGSTLILEAGNLVACSSQPLVLISKNRFEQTEEHTLKYIFHSSEERYVMSFSCHLEK